MHNSAGVRVSRVSRRPHRVDRDLREPAPLGRSASASNLPVSVLRFDPTNTARGSSKYSTSRTEHSTDT